MKRVLALVVLCAVLGGAHAQSYEDRARIEQAQQAMEAYDKLKMDEARAALAKEQKAPAAPGGPTGQFTDYLVLAGIFGAGWLVLKLLRALGVTSGGKPRDRQGE